MRRVKLHLIFVEVVDFGDTKEVEVGSLCDLVLTHFENAVKVCRVKDSEDSF